MQRFFTKNLFLLVCSFVVMNVSAQSINALTINSPSGLAGNYLIVRAQFGPQTSADFTADAGFAVDNSTAGTGGTLEDGCQPLTNSLTGKIAFVDRGACEFGLKSLNTQNAGAAVVIVCNNALNATQAPFPMTPGASGASVTVPTFLMSYSDCQKIRAEVKAGTVNATVTSKCVNFGIYGPTAVWGNQEGQGDFEGGLNDWTVDKANTWEFDEDGNIDKGRWIGTGVQMVSNSACNGVMLFNSDYLDNGDENVPGSGLCPADPCRGALISPVINLTGQNVSGIVIEFSQALRQFQSQYYIIASRDGGNTWPDSVRINQEYPVNSNAITSDRRRVALFGFKNAASLRFKFEYVGDYYYWAIDDVVVYNESKADVLVNETFFAGAPSLKVPASQVSEMPFVADIYNLGNANASNVELTLTITDANNVELDKLTNSLGNMPENSSVIDKVFTELYTPPATVGRYNAIYSVTSPEDPTGLNNTKNVSFNVTESTFGNILDESEVTPAGYMEYVLSPWTLGTSQVYYSSGNIYYVKDGKRLTAGNARFGLANAAGDLEDAAFIYVDLYEWTEDINGDNECQPNERVKVGTNNVFISADISDLRNIELPIWSLDAEGNPDVDKEVDLKDNTTYIIMAHAAPLDASVPQIQFLGYNGRSGSSFDRSSNYFPVNIAFDSLYIDNRACGSLFGVTGTSEDDVEERTFEIVQNGSLRSAAFLELDIVQAVSTFDIADNAEVKTFPNPASRELYLDVTLKNVSNEVRVDLVAMDGKVMTSKSFTNVLDSRLKLDLANVPSGTYSALIHTDKGVITSKVVVQK